MADKFQNQVVPGLPNIPGLPGADPSQPEAGGSSGSSGGTGAGKSYDVDNMLRTYLPGIMDDPTKVQAVKDELKKYESGSGGNYHTQITALIAAHPELQQYSKWGKAFPAQTPGQLTPDQFKSMNAVADQYMVPYDTALKSDSAMLAASLKDLLPRLPKNFQALVQAETPGLVNLPDQISNLIHKANPGQIMNAYEKQYAGTGTTPNTAAANIFNGIVPKPAGQ